MNSDMNITTIKNHMNRLAKGYRIWTVPLIMLLWETGVETIGGSTVSDTVKNLLSAPYFLMAAAWMILLGLAMDHSGRLLLEALQNTQDIQTISHIMLEHNRYGDLVIITPLVYLACKGAFMYVTAGSLAGIWRDIHFLICFIATYDGIRSVYGNVLIRKELDY